MSILILAKAILDTEIIIAMWIYMELVCRLTVGSPSEEIIKWIEKRRLKKK
jgi:hypothetical protein